MSKPKFAIIWLALGAFAMLLSACSLSASRNENSQETLPSQNSGVVPVDPILIIDNNAATTEEAQIQPTSTPRPTSTPINTTSGGTNGNTTGSTSGGTTACVIRTDWQIYTVVSGDTLSSIARRANSTVNQLASANCISDPSRISVGQSLRVPAQPIPPTQAPSQNQQVGRIYTNIQLPVNGSVNVLPANQTVRLEWLEASFVGLSSVEFVYVPRGTTQIISIGVDNYLADGAVLNWYVPTNIDGRIVARSQINTGGIRYSFDFLAVSQTADTPLSIGFVTISPANTSNGVDYTFSEGATIRLLWTQLPVANVTRVEFYMAIASAARPAPTLVGTDTNMSDGVSASVTLTARSGGVVTAIAYKTNGTTVTTAQSVTVFVVPNQDVTFGGNVSVYPAPRSENGVALLVEGSQVTLSWQNMPNVGVTWVEFTYMAGGGNTSAQTIGIDSNLADGIAVPWTVPAGASGRIVASGRVPGQTPVGAVSNDYFFNTVPNTDTGGGTTTTVQGAYQPFETGLMLWRSNPDGIYSLQNNGFVNYFSGAVYQAYPENPITDAPPPNRFSPVQGFGRVWGNVQTERDALGWATAQEQGYTMSITRYEGTGGPAGDGYMIVTLPDGRHVTIRDSGTWSFTN